MDVSAPSEGEHSFKFHGMKTSDERQMSRLLTGVSAIVRGIRGVVAPESVDQSQFYRDPSDPILDDEYENYQITLRTADGEEALGYALGRDEDEALRRANPDKIPVDLEDVEHVGVHPAGRAGDSVDATTAEPDAAQ